MSTPTLIFIPGAWHNPICYTKLTTILQTHYNLRCTTVTLPSTTGDPQATFKDDLDAACTAILQETENGKNVVVIAHSYGGLVGNSSIKNFTRPKQPSQNTPTSTNIINTSTNTNEKGYVIGLILIASGFTFTGYSFMDPFLGHPPPSWKINSKTGFADIILPPQEIFYHDLPAEERNYWTSKLTPQSLKALFEGGEYSYAGWMDVPAWYIGTVEDRGLPVVVQRMNVGMAREMGGVVEHRELRSSHSPFLSLPGEVAGILVDAVEAFTGKKVVVERGDDGRKKKGVEVVVPAVRFWQPLTWWSFGVPLFLGHVVGRGILAFWWCKRLWTGSR